jgi:ubiquinone/menaquinone biosynthesis C-methylase UbiE
VNLGSNIESQLRTASGNAFPTPDVPVPVSVAEGYERWAPIYDRTHNPLLAREERYLAPLLVNLNHKRILDVACGTGRWLEKLRPAGSAVGIDCSLAMLRVARTKTAIAGHLVSGFCEGLPFRSSTFDLAICSFALGHVRDLASMVRELARVTKPGADIFVSDLHPEAFARGWRVGFRDDSFAIEIETQPRAIEEILGTFHSSAFECLTLDSLSLGEPEKPIFARAGKAHSFAEACRLPAILVCHFKRLDSLGQSKKVRA